MEFPFSTSPHDRAVQYLYQIFGSMGGVLKGYSGGVQATGADAESTVLSEMFTTFNTIILGVAALIIIYVTVKGVLKTAHEGEMMGKEGSALWTPIKMVLGIAALVPTSVGYSAIQIVMMWVIVQGIAVADMVWGTAIAHVNVGGSLQAKFKIPEATTKTTVIDLFSGLTCLKTFAETLPNPEGPSGGGAYFCESNSADAFCASSFAYDINQTVVPLGPSAVCGTLTLCDLGQSCGGNSANNDASSLKCRVCKKQHMVMNNQLADDGALMLTAKLLEQTDYSYRNFYFNNDTSAGSDFKGDWIGTYCSESNIGNCCVPGAGKGDKACSTPKTIPGCTPPADNPAACENQNPFASLSPGIGTMNAPTGTVNTLYGPFSFVPALTGGSKNVQDIDFIDVSTKYYLSELESEVNQYMSEQGVLGGSGGKTANTSQFSQVLSVANETGWIMAGAFYNLIAKQNNNNFDAAVPTFKFEVDSKMNSPSMSPFKGNRSNYQTAFDLLSALVKQQQAAQGGSGGATVQPECPFSADFCGEKSPGAAMTTAITSTNQSFLNNLQSGSSGTNPLVAMQQLGYTLLFVAGVAFIALLVAIIFVSFAANLNAWVPTGAGMWFELGPALTFAGMLLVPVVAFFLGLLVLVGGTFGVYIPMIPYIVFTTGAIGWLLACIEAMVAGPLVALGILAPGGHHDILGKAEPALMLLFNIFLRPSLMIFGLIAAFFLSGVVIIMINSGFGILITTMGDVANTAANSATGYVIEYDAGGNPYIPGGAAGLAFNPVMLILILIVYVGIITTAMNKCFSAIYIIPERVISWIGGQAQSYGEAEAAGEFKGKAEGAAGSVKGGMEGAQSKGKEYGAQKSQDKKLGQEHAKAKADLSGKIGT